LGHARFLFFYTRTYLGFDIIRRIIEDYFHYNIKYVVNITDVDDKIIKKANLLLLKKIINSIKNEDNNIQNIKSRIEEDSKIAEKALTNEEINEFINKLNKINHTSSNESPNYFEVSTYWEDLFWKDMKSLNVKFPDTITRVTEYVEEIIEFIKTLLSKGYAYVSNNSVYFDTKKFNESKNHVYGKLGILNFIL
jgi:cysteinyl-tRNA synthetase